MLLSGAIFVPSQTVELTQTARHADGTTDLLKSMTPLALEPMASLPADKTLSVDTSVTFQEIVGFGGAFTEASAINWRLLSKDEQAEVIRMYFADPADGGHGYTIGRVPINSCDFSPASYSFDDTPGDVELKDFDDSVAHDVDVGMIPMIQQATDAVASRGLKLNMYASPWSPPAWMKLPGGSGNRSMVESASPNGLDPKYQRPWAEYFSRFISAYKAHGIDMWGVTVQNEPEAAVGWEAMLWTPQFQAQFVKNHLGPVLRAEQPGVKIIGFDHNKDHVVEWAKVLYADPAAAQYFDGIGVHWCAVARTVPLRACAAQRCLPLTLPLTRVPFATARFGAQVRRSQRAQPEQRARRRAAQVPARDRGVQLPRRRVQGADHRVVAGARAATQPSLARCTILLWTCPVPHTQNLL